MHAQVADRAQLNVPIETMIMMATSAAIGICATQSPSTRIRNSRNTPAQKRRQPAAAAGLHVDHRLADHRAAGHAAEKAGHDVGMPWPTHSRFLSLGVSVSSSTIAPSSAIRAARRPRASPNRAG
jgi:hypothetical protein